MGMPASHTLVFALMNGATGLTVPVPTRMLLARGATLETLSLFMGITLAVTVALEVPSGIAADALGRKRLFMIAMLLNVAGYVLLATGVSVWLVAASSVLRGMALAARTGTIESIEVDRIMCLPGSEEERLSALDRLNGRLTLLESGGTAAGSLVGGLLAALDGSYVTFYLFVGAWSVFEQTLLHQAAPARERSSMMSVQSIALRSGGFAASVAGVPLGAALSLPWVWLVFALVSLLPLLFSARGAGSRRAAGSCRTEGV